MKYANGYLHIRGKQVKAFVCAKTVKRIRALLSTHGISDHQFYGWWNRSANDVMKEIAKDREGIYVASSTTTQDYKRLDWSEDRLPPSERL